MKTLALMRHAKSDWSTAGLGDYDRPLAQRGLEAAPRMGRAIRDRGLAPGIILCSQARRARETWSLVEPELGVSVSVVFQRGLYLAPPDKILAAIQGLPGDCASAMLIGHNPGLEALAAGLAGPRSDPEALRRLSGKFPTAAVAVLTFDTGGWANLAANLGRLTAFLRPRDLP